MNYLNELCLDLEMDAQLEKKADGSCLFPINERLTLEMKPQDPGTYLFSPIGACPEGNKEGLYMQLMKANLFGQGTWGAAIGLSGDGKTLTLSRSIDYDMTYRDFRGALEDFANVVDYWKAQIERFSKADGGVL